MRGRSRCRVAPSPVTRVTYGYTIVVRLDGKDTKVRLIGVHTPDTSHPTNKVEYFGKETSAFTWALLKDQTTYQEVEYRSGAPTGAPPKEGQRPRAVVTQRHDGPCGVEQRGIEPLTS